MNSKDEMVRAAIAEQAAEWFVKNGEGPLPAADAAALAAWLKTSPVHVEEFLGVSAIARDLAAARTDPEYSLEAILARARNDMADEAATPVAGAARARPSQRWLLAAVLASVAAVAVGLFVTWGRPGPRATRGDMAALHLETRHGEQLTRRLADQSVLHLDTDSAVTIRYDKTTRRVTLDQGQAAFEVTHDPDRAFRVVAGVAEVVDIGTTFNVRLEQGSTVVTVVEGRVTVGPSSAGGTNPNRSNATLVALAANQQLRVLPGEWPAVPLAADGQHATSWLRREIAFDHEPLERVAAEYNRYAPKPIEIATPALRSLQVTGVFATDDTEAFIAFLRSLKGVRVEVTATVVRVSRD